MADPILMVPSPSRHGLSGFAARPMPMYSSPIHSAADAAVGDAAAGRVTTVSTTMLNSSLSNLGWLQEMYASPIGLAVARPQPGRQPGPQPSQPRAVFPPACELELLEEDEDEDEEASAPDAGAEHHMVIDLEPSGSGGSAGAGGGGGGNSGPAFPDLDDLAVSPRPLDSWGAAFEGGDSMTHANACGPFAPGPSTARGAGRLLLSPAAAEPQTGNLPMPADFAAAAEPPPAAAAFVPPAEPAEQAPAAGDQAIREYHAQISHSRPPYSYTAMIYLAIQDTGKDRVQLGEIYANIMASWAYYRARPNETGWKNSIRHNLTVSRCFKKVARAEGEAGKGGYWVVDKALALTDIVLSPRDSSPKLSRRKDGKKKKRPTPPKSQPKGMHSRPGSALRHQLPAAREREVRPRSPPSAAQPVARPPPRAPAAADHLPTHLLVSMFDVDMTSPPQQSAVPRAADHSTRVMLPERDEGFGAMAGCSFPGSLSPFASGCSPSSSFAAGLGV